MIILTGAKGFIGRNFKDALKGKKVIEVDIDNCWKFLASFQDWGDVELILHQGALSSTVCNNIDLIHELNVQYSILLFEKALKYGIPVKYASSASVYGNAHANAINPLNQYAISKLQIDYWVQNEMYRFYNIQGFRYFNVYGKYEENKIALGQASPISSFINDIKQDNKISLFKYSDEIFRDFVWVGDVVDIVLNNDKPSGVYDLGTSNPVSFQHVAEQVVGKFGGSIMTRDMPSYLSGKYQFYTCAQQEWPEHGFKTVKEYVNDDSLH